LALSIPAKTYGQLALDAAGDWSLSGVPPHVSIRLKHLFPSIEKGSVPPYRLRNTNTICADLDWFMSRYPLVVEDTAASALAGGRLRFEEHLAERERILRPDYTPPDRPAFRDGKALRKYQAQAVDLLASRGALLVGDEVGLGKTIVAAGALMLPDALPAGVVVEPHLQIQWQEKLQEFTRLKVYPITTTRARSLPPADVYLWRYSNIFGWAEVIADMKFGLASWDEIQKLRKGETETAMGRACAVLRDAARMKLGLTATPIYNYGIEIWEVLRFIDPAVLGDKYDFVREWAPGWKLEDPKALGSFLRDQHVFLRRTRADVGRELPPINRIVETIDYDEATLASVDALARSLAIKATTGSFVERGQAARDLDLRVRHATGVAKAKTVARFVRLLLEAGEPVLLVGWHRDVYDIWLDELRDFEPVMYTGSETAAAKNQAKEAILSGRTNLLILSLRSGAGLDGLQDRVSTVVFGELDWSPGIHHQVIGRLARERADGNENHVTAFFLVTEEGSDPPMMEVLGIKASEASGVVDPSLGVQAVHSDSSVLSKLVERYLTRRPRAPKTDEQPTQSSPALSEAA
jgi:hypothetical protein